MTDLEVARREPGTSIAHRARGQFDEGQYELIRTTVAADCNPAELAMFLEICARYELDPFSKQIWAVKIQGRVQIIVSRDGLLALANRHTPAQGYSGPGEFLGCESDVVREHDYFRKFRGPDGTEVEHEYRDAQGKPTASKEKRGKIIGAWALVHRREHKPTYFFGEWETYNGRNVWGSHPEAMMQKVPETMALRKAFSVSGVIGETGVPRANLTESSGGEAGGELNWPEDEKMKHELEERFAALGYRRAKQRAHLAGCSTPEEFEALRVQLDDEVSRQDTPPEEEITEAEVVS